MSYFNNNNAESLTTADSRTDNVKKDGDVIRVMVAHCGSKSIASHRNCCVHFYVACVPRNGPAAAAPPGAPSQSRDENSQTTTAGGVGAITSPCRSVLLCLLEGAASSTLAAAGLSPSPSSSQSSPPPTSLARLEQLTFLQNMSAVWTSQSDVRRHFFPAAFPRSDDDDLLKPKDIVAATHLALLRYIPAVPAVLNVLSTAPRLLYEEDGEEKKPNEMTGAGREVVFLQSDDGTLSCPLFTISSLFPSTASPSNDVGAAAEFVLRPCVATDVRVSPAFIIEHHPELHAERDAVQSKLRLLYASDRERDLRDLRSEVRLLQHDVAQLDAVLERRRRELSERERILTEELEEAHMKHLLQRNEAAADESRKPVGGDAADAAFFECYGGNSSRRALPSCSPLRLLAWDAEEDGEIRNSSVRQQQSRRGLGASGNGSAAGAHGGDGGVVGLRPSKKTQAT